MVTDNTSDQDQQDDSDPGLNLSILDGSSLMEPGFGGPHQTASEYFNPNGSIDQSLVTATRGSISAAHQEYIGKGQTGRMMGAIASLESGGNVTGAIRYNAIGPLCQSHVTGRFSSRVDGHALGGWQVMAENVGPWAREAGLGNVTPEQFLASPQLQQQIVGYQIQKLENKGYSVEDIASVWQSGRPLDAAERAGASDQNMSTVRYAETVQRHYDALGNVQLAANQPPPGPPAHPNHQILAQESSKKGPDHEKLASATESSGRKPTTTGSHLIASA